MKKRPFFAPLGGSSDGMGPGDGVGNRRPFREFKIPPDNIGNRAEMLSREELLADDIGNRIDAAPTHTQSGILTGIDGKKGRRKEDPMVVRNGRYLVGGVNPVISGQTVPVAEPTPRPLSKAAPTNRRLFEFDEEERFDYMLKSEPEQKRKIAEETVRTILEKAGSPAQVNAVLLQEEERFGVMVLLEEQLSRSESELSALNFLVNKIVNRYPDDRIRLAVVPKAEEAVFAEHFRDKQQRT